MVLVKAFLVVDVRSDAFELLVGLVAVVFVVAVAAVVVVAAEFVVAGVELQAEARVETGVVEKVLASVEFDSAEERAVVYVGFGAAEVVAAVGLLENCIAAAVEGLAQAAVTAGIWAAAKDAGIEVDVVV